jgi:hypothetical protein
MGGGGGGSGEPARALRHYYLALGSAKYKLVHTPRLE